MPSRIGNYLRTVSCRDEQQWRHVEWETMGEQFPVVMSSNGAKPDRKPHTKKLRKNVDSFFLSFFYLPVLQISATASTSFTGMRWAPAAWMSRRACTSSLERVMPVSLPPFSMAFITAGGMKMPGTLLFR